MPDVLCPKGLRPASTRVSPARADTLNRNPKPQTTNMRPQTLPPSPPRPTPQAYGQPYFAPGSSTPPSATAGGLTGPSPKSSVKHSPFSLNAVKSFMRGEGRGEREHHHRSR